METTGIWKNHYAGLLKMISKLLDIPVDSITDFDLCFADC